MTRKRTLTGLMIVGLVMILAALLTTSALFAQESAPESTISRNVLHPTFPLLDSEGANVLESGAAVSTIATCGICHDTAFIAQYSVHTDVGQRLAGQVETDRAWQDGIGLYGGWNPITYDVSQDLSAEAWVSTFGARHVGGGPAAEVGVEMNCFLCHLDGADNTARINALENGDFAWASTATLAQTGVVQPDGDGWTYDEAAFDDDGVLLQQSLTIAEPSNAACSQCHGLADDRTQEPLSFNPTDAANWQTLTTGQVYSPQRLSNSGVNLAQKSELTRTWDVHAERAVDCVDCHYSLNNPVFYVEGDESRPEHLNFDPRRMTFDDYLTRPLHQFANGGSKYAEAFPIFEEAGRDCESCHDAVSTHTWLAYPASHMEALACETCHIPAVYAPALETVDWTLLDSAGDPLLTYRGLRDDTSPALLTGYTPTLLRDDEDRLAPYNVVSAWYWVYGDPAQPILADDLRLALFENDAYAPEIIALFDTDGDGDLNPAELIIDNDDKETLIANRLSDYGYADVRIAGETAAYPLHHNVTHGDWAISECSTCHSEDSLLAQPMELSGFIPGGVLPTLIGDALDGSSVNLDSDSALLTLTPPVDTSETERYIFGHDSVSWVDWAGILLLLGTVGGVMVHGGLRYVMTRNQPIPDDPELREVYMYSIYERQWHWLQTVVIFGLLFTGLIIHKPEMFGFLSFRWIVLVHNAFALILIVNAALAAFYHFVSGEIQQFLPEPRGFFGAMFAQARYYAWGIFRGEPHPMEKTPERKLNPIQQLTYLGLLNVLLPAQVITGALMWGAQHWPEVTALAGGLGVLAPLHTLISWTMASFIVLHVYMTTTGHEPLTNIRAMIFGWDEVEVHGHAAGD